MISKTYFKTFVSSAALCILCILCALCVSCSDFFDPTTDDEFEGS